MVSVWKVNQHILGSPEKKSEGQMALPENDEIPTHMSYSALTLTEHLLSLCNKIIRIYIIYRYSV